GGGIGADAHGAVAANLGGAVGRRRGDLEAVCVAGRVVDGDAGVAAVAVDRGDGIGLGLGAMGGRDARGALEPVDDLVGPGVDTALGAHEDRIVVGPRRHAGEECAVAGLEVERAAGVPGAGIDAHATGAELAGGPRVDVAPGGPRAIEV